MPPPGDYVMARPDRGATLPDAADEAQAGYLRRHGQPATVILVHADDKLALGELPGVEVRVGPVARGVVYAGGA
jgi:hypothetical protein